MYCSSMAGVDWMNLFKDYHVAWPQGDSWFLRLMFIQPDSLTSYPLSTRKKRRAMSMQVSITCLCNRMFYFQNLPVLSCARWLLHFAGSRKHKRQKNDVSAMFLLTHTGRILMPRNPCRYTVMRSKRDSLEIPTMVFIGSTNNISAGVLSRQP